MRERRKELMRSIVAFGHLALISSSKSEPADWVTRSRCKEARSSKRNRSGCGQTEQDRQTETEYTVEERKRKREKEWHSETEKRRERERDQRLRTCCLVPGAIARRKNRRGVSVDVWACTYSSVRRACEREFCKAEKSDCVPVVGFGGSINRDLLKRGTK